ncbi:transcriptional regulator [Thiothrix winogradskyi]|uniref:Transcriptional regulator n=1 Tax=Thiothrix winogradskyi TaxID=96472 RepID=A0ABY3T5M6_9GAMM|nr:transcriptional regulator [Thiothrix winogradskyi]UJS25991.1 transcriptional regulator [Thiothrix winogradskyi]
MQQPGRRVKLAQHKEHTADAWQQMVSGQPLYTLAGAVNAKILRSWQRSLQHLNPWQPRTLLQPSQWAGNWDNSPLQTAIQHMQAELAVLVEEGGLVAGLTDSRGCLLWTVVSRPMEALASAARFTPGCYWDEHSVGTNAIGLALASRQQTMVFAAEHYSRHLHDWVAYAAPVVYPASGELAGIFCVATTWEKHTPLGEMAVADLARSIQRHLPASLIRAELQVHALGFLRVQFRGKEIHCSLRQIEILCLLILNPQGLTLAGLHSALYGDKPVALTTLKVELSHLRQLLDGHISSRPYRLTVDVWADFVDLWQILKERQIEKAVALYRGVFLPQSASPELEEWRNCMEAVMTKMVDMCADATLLLDNLCQGTQVSELVRTRLLELTAKSA